MAPILTMDQFDYQRTVSGVLKGAFGQERHGAKKLAEAAGTNVSTAKNWLDEKSTPQGLHLLRLIATVPELQSEVLRLAAIETAMPAEFEKAVLGLVHSYRRIKATEGA